MKESSDKIVRLCESWWTTLANSTRSDEHQFAGQLLALLGWTGPEAAPVSPAWTKTPGVCCVLRGGGDLAVAAYFVGPGLLEPPGALVERNLDFCAATRALTADTRAANIPYAFITDLYRSYLYDIRGDELLLHADTPVEFEREIAPVLVRDDVERGALEEVRRQPRSYAARQLREWCQRWSAQLSAGNPLISEESAAAAIDRLFVLGFLLSHDVLRNSGCELQKSWDGLCALAACDPPEGCGKALTELFGELWTKWGAGVFAPVAHLEDALSSDMTVALVLREFALLSRGKFSIATILESFNYGEPAEKARVRMVPEPNKDREAYLAKQTAETIGEARIELDIAYEGYRAVFYWFDKLVALYERLEASFDGQPRNDAPVSGGLDLLTWAEEAASKPRALGDKRAFAAESGLVIYCASPRQWRIARMMLCLHFIGRCYQAHDYPARFPGLHETIKPRPRTLDVDRRWSNGQTARPGSGGGTAFV